MRLSVIGIIVLTLAGQSARAQSPATPYTAVVNDDDVYARSGPGRNYYPTSKLQRGDRVTVHRHDPGGWRMILPPPGSASWIRAEYVKRAGEQRGVVTENNVVVRVGSSFSDIQQDVEQRRLSQGDVVTILAEKTIQTGRGELRMFQIKPPQGEYRWVPGTSIVPADNYREPTQHRPHDHRPDPFAESNPTDSPKHDKHDSDRRKADKHDHHHHDSPFQMEDAPHVADDADKFKPPIHRPSRNHKSDDDIVERDLVRINEGDAIYRNTPPADDSRSERQQLARLDQAFRDMLQGDTRDWKFSGLFREYQRLQAQADNPAIAGQVDSRLDALQHYQSIKNEYDDFVRLTSETNRRDAQLLSIQQQTQFRAETPQPQPQPLTPAPNSVPSVFDSAGPATAPHPHPHRTPRPTSRPAPRDTRTPRFDGAGIIQRSATTYRGAPKHVLIAPNGRILAYLQSGAPGLDLDRYVGQSMGVYGQRTHRADLQTDFMVVKGLTPVRLKP